MQITTLVQEDGNLEQIIVTSSNELISIIQHLIIRQFPEGQVNIHIKDDGQVYITKPVFQN